MQINLTDVISFDGKVQEITTDIHVKQIQFGESIYLFGDDIHINLVLSNQGDKEVNIKGNLDTTIKIPCDRCMEEVDYKIKADFSKDIKFTNDEKQEDIDYISGYILDLEKLVLNEIMINLPMKVLCSDSCKGICNQCGINLNNKTCQCEDDNIDPRLAGLKDLFDQFKEV